MRLKALAETYKMHPFAPFWNRIRTVLESNPKKRGKPWGEKILVQSRENRPGEAHKQPQLATQYYPRARSKYRPPLSNLNFFPQFLRLKTVEILLFFTKF